jgi:hypothetical protein
LSFKTEREGSNLLLKPQPLPQVLGKSAEAETAESEAVSDATGEPPPQKRQRKVLPCFT